MATFHPLPRLPAELRIKIWMLPIKPRFVRLQYDVDNISGAVLIKSPTRVPSPLHTCHESRELYKRVYTEAFTGNPDPYPCIWINFDIDTIVISDRILSFLNGTTDVVESDLTRIRFLRLISNGVSNIEEFGEDSFRSFRDMENLTILLTIHVAHRFGVFDLIDGEWGCSEENVTILHIDTGESWNAEQERRTETDEEDYPMTSTSNNALEPGGNVNGHALYSTSDLLSCVLDASLLAHAANHPLLVLFFI